VELLVATLIVAPSVAGAMAWLRRRATLDRLEPYLRRLRSAVDIEPVYRAVRADDPPPHAQLEQTSAALVALGFHSLGDTIPERGTVRSRWFADAASTTIAMVLVIHGRAQILMASRDADRVYSSRRTSQRSLAGPPSTIRTDLDRNATLVELFTAHRRAIGDSAALRSFGDLDTVLAFLAERQAEALAWRGTQAPDALLEADLRSYLGPHYKRLGPALTTRLRNQVPTARARRA
jgi:hypothetical protein